MSSGSISSSEPSRTSSPLTSPSSLPSSPSPSVDQSPLSWWLPSPPVEGPIESISVGKSPSECKCKQEEKIVVLVGCTQHGKSSLIRSILDYGGYHEVASGVQIGSFGNVSTTKGPRIFSASIPIRKHVLHDQRGNVRPFNPRDGEPDDLYELTPKTISQPRSKHVHLKIVDTPGLDDSDNGRSPENPALGAQMRVVDEQHKLAVLKALANLGRIHTVCFVIDIGPPLGSSFQALLKEYLDIFEKSSLDASFHVAHTKVDLERLFEDKARLRPGVIEKTFEIGGRTKHHLLNNLPDAEDPISKHFADSALSKLCEELGREKGQPTRQLCYPKSVAHRTMDDILKATITAWETAQRAKIRALETERDDSDSMARILDRRRATELTHWCDVHREVQELDSEDLVEVGFESKYERGHLFSKSRLYFSVPATSPIRDIERTKCSDSYWLRTPATSEYYGERRYSTSLEGYNICTDIKGSITLYGWKKEFKADELATTRENERSAWSDLEATEKRIEVLQEKSKKAASKIPEIELGLEKLRRDMACLQWEAISHPFLKTRAAYFASSSIISYTVGLQLSCKFPKSLLGDGTTDADIEDAVAEIDAYHEELAKLLTPWKEATEKACKRVQSDRDKLSKLLNVLQMQLALAEAELSKAHSAAASIPEWELKNPFSKFIASASQRAPVFQERLVQKMKDRSKRTTEGLGEIIGTRLELLKTNLKFIRAATVRVEALMESSRSRKDSCRNERLKADSISAALESVRELLDDTEFPLGVIAFFQQEEQSNRLKSLTRQIAETYMLDPSMWPQVKSELN